MVCCQRPPDCRAAPGRAARRGPGPPRCPPRGCSRPCRGPAAPGRSRSGPAGLRPGRSRRILLLGPELDPSGSRPCRPAALSSWRRRASAWGPGPCSGACPCPAAWPAETSCRPCRRGPGPCSGASPCRPCQGLGSRPCRRGSRPCRPPGRASGWGLPGPNAGSAARPSRRWSAGSPPAPWPRSSSSR